MKIFLQKKQNVTDETGRENAVFIKNVVKSAHFVVENKNNSIE